MSKLSKVLLIFFITLLFSFNFCNAIDLNLTENNVSNTSGSSNSAISNNNVANNSSTSNTHNASNTSSNSTSNISTTVSGVASVTSSNNSTIANILNIALIVVGVLLIFLAIAILIRLKK